MIRLFVVFYYLHLELFFPAAHFFCFAERSQFMVVVLFVNQTILKSNVDSTDLAF